jgi:acetolactate synthase-1/2/3 large subunit
VPGESYLAVLDALHDAKIDVVNARHEGGAAMMAEADGKMTGRPGIAFVTRGPGATNAASGVHVAKQDSTPMILFVGQIGRRMKGREAFQEVDYRQTFRDLAKWVEEIDHADRIPEVLSHAFHVAMSGRPGPVVLALPEDMLKDRAEARPGPRVTVAAPAPSAADVSRFGAMLAAAERPVLLLGGSRWDAAAVEAARAFAEQHDLPTAVTFRRQGLFDHDHPNYAGDLGIGPNPKLKARVAGSDLLILLGGRLSEMPSQGFSLLAMPAPQVPLVHVHPGAEEIGRIYAPALGINATPGAFLEAVSALPARAATGAATMPAPRCPVDSAGAGADARQFHAFGSCRVDARRTCCLRGGRTRSRAAGPPGGAGRTRATAATIRPQREPGPLLRAASGRSADAGSAAKGRRRAGHPV